MNFDNIKKMHKSLTMWFNGIVLTVMPIVEISKESLPQLQEFLGVETYKVMGLSIIVVNMLLRFKTNKPLSDK